MCLYVHVCMCVCVCLCVCDHVCIHVCMHACVCNRYPKYIKLYFYLILFSADVCDPDTAKAD